MSDVDEAAAILAVLNAALAAMATPREAFELDEQPDKHVTDYVTFSLSRRFGDGEGRGGSGPGTVQRRVLTRYVSRSSVNNARVLRRVVTAALENAAVSVGGKFTSPIQWESDEAIGPDDGWYSGADTWTYTL